MQAVKIGGVSEGQGPVVELDGPAPAWFGDATVSDDDGVSSRIAEVFDDDPEELATATGIHPHTVAHRKVRTV